MSRLAAEPSAPTRLPERHGQITTLPDRRLGWGPAARARIALVVFWGNLICQMGIIVTGGLVRLTGSGLGCSTWPHCEPGQFTPELTLEAGIHPLVEYGNRALTLVLTAFAAALLLVSWRWLAHKGRGFRLLTVVPLVGTVLQALIGALVVFADLHPGLVSPHFLISPVIGAFSTVLLVRLVDGDGAVRMAVAPRLWWILVPLAALGFTVLILGTIVTGTGPHSGDSGDITRIALDPVLVSRLHAGAVWIFCALLIALLVALERRRARGTARLAAWLLLVVTIVQGVIGYIQYFLGLPELVVFLHLIGAALFAPAITLVGARMVTWQVPGDEHPRPAPVIGADGREVPSPSIAEARDALDGSVPPEAAEPAVSVEHLGPRASSDEP